MNKKLNIILYKEFKDLDFQIFVLKNNNYKLFNYIITHKKSYYKTFYINKKNGTKREINQPLKQLFEIQKQISLYLLIKRKNINVSHGFEINRSILSNAKSHTNKNIVVNFDLKNFFLNISKERIKMILESKFNLYGNEVEKIAELLTYNNYLPQGSPSSPILSNYVCEELDKELNEFCQKNGIIYTRYADDLTFSFDDKRLNDIKINSIREIIIKHDFLINERKFKCFYKNKRQIVTGLTVNEKVNVSKKFYKLLRAIIYNWENKGDNFTQKKISEIYDKNSNFAIVIKSWLNFFGFIKGFENSQYIRLKDKFNKIIINSQDPNIKSIGILNSKKENKRDKKISLSSSIILDEKYEISIKFAKQFFENFKNLNELKPNFYDYFKFAYEQVGNEKIELIFDKLVYGWTQNNYEFHEKFSFEDIYRKKESNISKKVILEILKIINNK